MHHLPTPGKLRDCAQVSRQAAQAERQRRDGVGTSSHTTELWRADDHGNLVHRGPCEICREYALHVYEHVLDEDPAFLNMKDCQDEDLTAHVRLRDDRIFNDYEDDNRRLKNKLQILEQELG